MCDAACIMGTPRIGIPRVPKSWGPMAVVRWPLLQGHISVKFPWMNQSFCILSGPEVPTNIDQRFAWLLQPTISCRANQT